jgi:hypothetical protein
MSWIRNTEFKYFSSKKWFLSSRKYDPVWSSRIRVLIFYPSRIPDPGVKKAPDPGSGSARLLIGGYVCPREYNGPVIVVSPDGGVDIEEVAEKTPERILKMPIDIHTGRSSLPEPEVKYGVRSSKFNWAPYAQLYSLAETPQPLPFHSPYLGSYTLLASQERLHLIVMPWSEPNHWRYIFTPRFETTRSEIHPSLAVSKVIISVSALLL